MSLAYGVQVQENDDPYIANAEQAVHTVFSASLPGKYLVDTLPILKYMPTWMPGAGFQRTAKQFRSLLRTVLEVPYAAARRKLVSTRFLSSYHLPLKHLRPCWEGGRHMPSLLYF